MDNHPEPTGAQSNFLLGAPGQIWVRHIPIKWKVLLWSVSSIMEQHQVWTQPNKNWLSQYNLQFNASFFKKNCQSVKVLECWEKMNVKGFFPPTDPSTTHHYILTWLFINPQRLLNTLWLLYHRPVSNITHRPYMWIKDTISCSF